MSFEKKTCLPFCSWVKTVVSDAIQRENTIKGPEGSKVNYQETYVSFCGAAPSLQTNIML